MSIIEKHRELPRTSGCTPHDFEVVLERLDREYPGVPILYLAYSSCTTCSMQSALIAAQGRENVLALDTKSVTAGQAAIVLTIARLLREHPETTLEQAADAAKGLIARVRMGFIPGDLDYLRAGGRVSNGAYLGAQITRHSSADRNSGRQADLDQEIPRNHEARCHRQMTREFPAAQNLEKDALWLIYGAGLGEDIMREVEAHLHEQGCQNLDVGADRMRHFGAQRTRLVRALSASANKHIKNRRFRSL